jgi:hypothetical protein
MMQTDVNAIALTIGDSVDYPVRLKGLVISYEAGTGSVVLKDGDTNGSTLFEFTAPPTNDGSINVIIPGEGIRAQTSIFADDITDATVTVFYG